MRVRWLGLGFWSGFGFRGEGFWSSKEGAEQRGREDARNERGLRLGGVGFRTKRRRFVSDNMGERKRKRLEPKPIGNGVGEEDAVSLCTTCLVIRPTPTGLGL